MVGSASGTSTTSSSRASGKISSVRISRFGVHSRIPVTASMAEGAGLARGAPQAPEWAQQLQASVPDVIRTHQTRKSKAKPRCAGREYLHVGLVDSVLCCIDNTKCGPYWFEDTYMWTQQTHVVSRWNVEPTYGIRVT